MNYPSSYSPNLDDAYKLYNTLPDLEDAYKLFESSDGLLDHLPHNVYEEQTEFVVTLVHRHASLKPGEIMVTRGHITQPEQVSSYHPSLLKNC
jgi:hypothetical protein